RPFAAGASPPSFSTPWSCAFAEKASPAYGFSRSQQIGRREQATNVRVTRLMRSYTRNRSDGSGQGSASRRARRIGPAAAQAPSAPFRRLGGRFGIERRQRVHDALG